MCCDNLGTSLLRLETRYVVTKENYMTACHCMCELHLLTVDCVSQLPRSRCGSGRTTKQAVLSVTVQNSTEAKVALNQFKGLWK